MRYFLLIIAFFSFFITSCEDKKDDIPPYTDQTIFMYYPWSGDLTDAFENNIKDFEKVIARGVLRNHKVLVFFSSSPTKATLYEITRNGAEAKRTTLKNYTDPPFTTAQGITDILNDVKGLAPANRYSMIIGCHGLGWLPVPVSGRARTVDQKPHWEVEGGLLTRYFGGTSTKYQTNITTLAEGISDAGIKMEYILFDDCYMSTVEVAYDLKDVTDYLIASPTEIMAFGMPYEKIGQYLVGNVNYEAISREFLSFYENYPMPCGTIGITVCSELEKLAEIMKEINGRFTFNESLLSSIQRLDGYSTTIFFDYADYVSKLCTDTELLARFNEQLERTVPSKYCKHTEYYYSRFPYYDEDKKIKINTYCGTTISDPSRNPSTTYTKTETAWYEATH